MNRYRAEVSFPTGTRYSFDVDASNIGVAASRALGGFYQRDEASIHVKLITRNIARKRREKYSHGAAFF